MQVNERLNEDKKETLQQGTRRNQTCLQSGLESDRFQGRRANEDK
jgi:hypothetical protein